MKNKLIDVSIKTMIGQLPDIITKNNESIRNEFDNIYIPGQYDPEQDSMSKDTIIVPEIDTTNRGTHDGHILTTKIECYAISLDRIQFGVDSQGNPSRGSLQTKRNIVKDVSHNLLKERYMWKQGTVVKPLPDSSIPPEMKNFAHNAGAIGVQMANNEVKSLAEIINGMIEDMDNMRSHYRGTGSGVFNNDGYVNIYGASGPKSGSLEEPDSFTFDNNVLFSTKTQLKRMNLPTYQYNDLTDGLIYTYYNYNDVVTISDEHTASISAVPGAFATIRFNDQKKKAFYRIVLSRKENKFLRISKDELVRLQLICVNDTPEYGTEWDVNTYSVRNAEDLVIERK